MDLQILDIISEGEAMCVLCKTSLEQYVTNLPDGFRDFHIQRGIVTNRFLDNLWETLSNKRHIPAIVLVSEETPPTAKVGTTFNLSSEFKVLDGLQRSHRLKEIWDTVRFIKSDFEDDPEIPVARLTRQKAFEFREKSISPQIFQKVLESKRSGVDTEKLFTENSIWLEVWFNLTDTQQIQKMLLLNAGHKSVNIKHQIELIFWSNYKLLENELKPSSISREKDRASTTYSKGRTQGEFHFAHLISAFLSLNEGKTVTTNADFSASHSFKEEAGSDASLLEIDEHLLSAFATTLKTLDDALQDDTGIRWLGREVVLVGIFGAIGAFAKECQENMIETLSDFNSRISEYVAILNLAGFEKWRNTLELSKVNIGNVNKRAVFNATTKFLKAESGEKINWETVSTEGNRNDAS